MKAIDTAIPEVKRIVSNLFGDERGYFMETYREQWFKDNIADVRFVQANQSKSKHGILRGLHYQIKQPQGKLVRVIAGKVFDVAVDLRRSSSTFGQWVGFNLSCSNQEQLWIPPGFAHGFFVVSESATFVYQCTDYYAPEFERSLVWNDPALSIDWPIANDEAPILSEKDRLANLFKQCETYS